MIPAFAETLFLRLNFVTKKSPLLKEVKPNYERNQHLINGKCLLQMGKNKYIYKNLDS